MTTPGSTYRLQLGPGLTFDDVAELVPHLADLGVGAVYLSPVLDATPGSTHGYDVVDPTRLRPELGGDAGWARLVAAVQEAGLGCVVDVVPNHVSIEVPRANPWFWDVLTHGRASELAGHFDVDWSRGRLLLPVLGADADVADLELVDGCLGYHEHRFPVAPGTEGGTPQEVHERQHYELVGWRRGNAELGYRRFFDITTLAAVRVEDPAVFHDAHDEVLRRVEAGEVTGLRVDHPDGLADPTGYAERLRAAAPDAWIVLEKILHPGESLPSHWPVDGTTGYDVLREVTGVLTDPAGDPGDAASFALEEERARRLVTDEVLVAEVRRIAALVRGVDADDARGAVAETMIAFDVYRSYLPHGREHWDRAIATARSRRPHLAEALEALDAQVTGEPDGELATRIQQTSGMVVAKGTEDTTFYRFTRFAALTEVGGSPDHFGLAPADFHALAGARETGWPRTMTTLTTHDTKRSEDVRARLLVLAEDMDEWRGLSAGWSARAGLDEPSLDALAWQTLVGAWPIDDDRLSDYLLKAAREAKLRTSWTDPDTAFEADVAAWPARVRADAGLWAEVEAYADAVTPAGWSNGLAQKLLQLVGPGVPDVYQGTELWDLSLVDPDNRRPVDHALRREVLARVRAGEVPPIDASGAAKLLLVHRVLTLRRDRPDLFSGYRSLVADGPASTHALAFGRAPGLVAVATRLPRGLARTGGWRDTTLPLEAGAWTDVLTGTTHDADAGGTRLADLLATYPVALLVRADAD